MLKFFSLRRLIILFGVFALLFSIFLALHKTPTARSDDPAGIVIESDDSFVTQQGAWTTQAASGASGGGYLYSSGDESDALLLPFDGSRIEIIYVKNPDLGDFAIEIDSVIVRTVVTTSDETSFGNSAVVDYLEAGPHVVKIFAVEGVIAIDAFIGTPFSMASDDAIGPAPAGETEAFSPDFSDNGVDDTLVETIHEPNAPFIVVHFAELDLAAGETVTVSSDDGTQVHSYPGSDFSTDEDPGFWALVILDDTVNIEIHGDGLNPEDVSDRVVIDKYYRGYSDTELIRAESYCGSNQLQSVTCYQTSHSTEYNNATSTAKLIIPGVGVCTAWRVGPNDLMLTNRHCITPTVTVSSIQIVFNFRYSTCSGPTTAPTTIVTGNQLLAASDPDPSGTTYPLDFALFSVNSAASISGFGYLALDIRAPNLNEQIYIPQHPEGQHKQFGIYSDADSGSVCRINDAQMNEFGLPNDTGYYCDTLPGSSGSAVIARSSNRAIALHHFGSGATGSYCNAGTGYINTGVRIDMIWPYISSYLATYIPDVPTLVSPIADVTTGIAAPTYQWEAEAAAEWYQIIVRGPSGDPVNQWYTPTNASCGGGTGTCSVTPSINLTANNYDWWIQAWSSYGNIWSQRGDFTVKAPSEVVRVSPQGSISTNPPTFTWNAGPLAEKYQLLVHGPTNTAIIDQLFTKSDAGCAAGTGTCSVTPNVTQQGGTHKWWIRAWSPVGYGPWSSTSMIFNQTNGIVKPQTISLIAPIGDVADDTPTYSWNADSWAEQYRVYVTNSSGAVVLDHWVTKTNAGCPSGAGTCSTTPTTVLAKGNHTLWIVGWNSLGYGPWINTIINITVGPSEVVRISPQNNVSTNPPTFTWNADPYAHKYQLYVNGPTGTNIIDQLVTKEAAGCAAGTGTCSVTPNIVQKGGAHQWWIRAWSPPGYGPWTPAAMNFNQTNGIVTPPMLSIIEPSGDTADNTPTYSWSASPWAEWYRVYVTGPSGAVVVDQWYTPTSANCPAGTGTCSVTPATVLARGNHTFWIVGWNSLGYGTWNNVLVNITVGAPTTPATLISPTGNITTRTPTFTWNANNEATQYRLYVSNSSGILLDQVFTAASVGCGAGTGTCSHTPAGPILAVEGAHSWWIRVVNSYGNGPWSAEKTFNYKPPAPAAATLISPTGNTMSNPPTYTWNASANATWYLVYVSNGSSVVVSQWFSAVAAGCPYGTGTCSATPSTALASLVSYNWYIQSYNTSGTSWSGASPFTLGFNSQFNSDATDWVQHTGTWAINTAYLFTNPSTTDLSTASNMNTFQNIDYQVRIQRTGCATCANTILVRGDPAGASSNSGNNWTSGYRFQITRNGLFSVFRVDSGSTVQLQGWTTTGAINQGDLWNTLRVVANGGNFTFYINGVMVWTGTDSTYATGRVGVGMYRSSGDTNDEITVDWATLTVPAAAAPSPRASVSPEQRALNEVANRNESSSSSNTAPPAGSALPNGTSAPPERGVGTELPREG